VANADDDEEIDAAEKEAQRRWKEANPGKTIKHWRRLQQNGRIKEVPWNHPDYYPDYQKDFGLQADNQPDGTPGEVKGFGITFPEQVQKGDMFLRVDRLPSALFKFNGSNWIEVDKNLTDGYAYDDAYLDHLIEKIGTGQYDPDLLSDAERTQIELKLQSKI
jgi:hypothetical protein